MFALDNVKIDVIVLPKLISPLYLELNQVPFFLINDGFMVAFDIVLVDLSLILTALLGQKIYRIGFLQEGITHVLLILEHPLNGSGVPVGFPIPTWNPFFF